MRSADKHFEIGEDVLVLVPDNTASKLFSKWCRAKIIAKRSPYSYEVDLDGVKRHYHANHLRKYHVRVESVVYDSCAYGMFVDDEPSTTSVSSCSVIYDVDDDFGEVQTLPTSLKMSDQHDLPSTKIEHDSIKHLSRNQQKELLDLLDQYPQCFFRYTWLYRCGHSQCHFDGRF